MRNEFEIYLIEAVKRQPILYDRTADGYSNKEALESAWNEVTKEVSKHIKNINVTHCRLRWRTLRDRFVKQITRTPDGDEYLSPKANRWEYTKRLSFLINHLKKRKCEEIFTPVSIKKEMQTKRSNTNNTGSSSNSRKNPQHSFSFVDAKCIHNSSQSNDSNNLIFDSGSQESEDEPEIEIPEQSAKRQKFNEIEFSTDSFAVQESELVTTNNSDLTVNINENNLNKLLITTNSLLQQQLKQNMQRSPNDAYFQVLDGYFEKIPADELDRVKVEILNLLVLKKKTAMKRQ